MKKYVYSVMLLSLALTTQAQIIQTIAGTYANGRPATNMNIGLPQDVACDKFGNLYVIYYNGTLVWKVDTSGKMYVIAGSGSSNYSPNEENQNAIRASFNNTISVACDTSGNVYIADYGTNFIRKMNSSGLITRFAGGGSSSSEGINATAVRINALIAVTTDRTGNVYYVDRSSQKVRKITPANKVYTIAGSGTSGYDGDNGPATAAKISSPTTVKVDKTGNVFFVDQAGKRIRKVDTNGIITTFAGNGSTGYGGDGGQATAAVFSTISGITIDSSGNVYIADQGNNLIRMVNSSGIINKAAGQYMTGSFAGDGGVDTLARFYTPMGMTFDNLGNYFIADWNNYRIRKVSATRIVTTVAGTSVANNGYSGDGGLASLGKLNNPLAVAIDRQQNIYVADCNNNVVRKISPSGIVSTYAGINVAGSTENGGPATNAKINSPRSVAADKYGNVFITDGGYYNVIRKISASGIISNFAGTLGSSGFSGDGGPATSAKLNGPGLLTVDTFGNLFVSDGSNYRIRKIDTSGIISTVIGTGGSSYFGDGGAATNAQIGTLKGLTVDRSGNIFLSDNYRIRKINTSGIINTIAGNGSNTYSGDGGPATASTLYSPGAIICNNVGDIYFSDGNCIRKIDTANIITRYAGTGYSNISGDGGYALYAGMSFGTSMAVDSSGNLVFADQTNQSVRIIYPASAHISASANPVCLGSPVTFHATYSGPSGIRPRYQWMRNKTIAGADSSSWTTSALANNDTITCTILNAANGLPVAISDTIRMSVQSNVPTLTLNVSPNRTICAGTPVTFTASASNGGSAPRYQWYTQGNPIPGATNATYSTIAGIDSVVGCTLFSNATCRSVDSAHTVTVLDVTDSAHRVTLLSDKGDSVCAGTAVTLTAFVPIPSSSAIYTWYLNGATQPYIGPTLNVSPHNADAVYVVLSGDANCPNKASYNSQVKTFSVSDKVTPSVTISAAPGTTVRAGTSVTCTATVVNGGTAPSFNWIYWSNGIRATISTTNTCTLVPTDNAFLFCDVTSNERCLTSANAHSQNLTFTIDTSSLPIRSNAGIFPNPNDGTFSLNQEINEPDGTNIDMTIFAVSGKEMYKQILIVNNKLVTGNFNFGRKLPPGEYLVTLAYFTGKKQLRFVVRY